MSDDALSENSLHIAANSQLKNEKIKRLFQKPILKKHVDSSIRYLLHDLRCSKKVRKKPCHYEVPHCTPAKNENGVTLRSKHLGFIVESARHAFLLHDWDSVSELLSLVYKCGCKETDVYKARALLVLFINHHKSSPEILCNFIRNVTRYMEDNDIERLVLLSFGLREKLLNQLKLGKFVRKTSLNKVIDDPNYQLSYNEPDYDEQPDNPD